MKNYVAVQEASSQKWLVAEVLEGKYDSVKEALEKIQQLLSEADAPGMETGGCQSF